MPLSRKALENKRAYNRKRNKELTNLFSARLFKEEYNDLCSLLKLNNMNKADFVRWAYQELKRNT